MQKLEGDGLSFVHSGGYVLTVRELAIFEQWDRGLLSCHLPRDLTNSADAVYINWQTP
jgi:hypothetical protein